MIESLNNLNNAQEVSNTNLEKAAMSIMLLMAEGYMYSKDGITMGELLKQKNIECVPGKLYNYHIVVLQTMLNEDLSLMGLTLSNEVAKNGETYRVGELSNFEAKLLTNRVNLVSGVVSLIEKRVNK